MRKRVLVPLDGSRVANSVVTAILKIAGPVEVALLRVVQPTLPAAVEGARHLSVRRLFARVNETREFRARIGLYRIGAYLRGRGLQVKMHVRRGAPAPEILAAARDAEVDFIAMPTHSRDGLGPRPVDSVAEAVLRGATVPVLMVPPAERKVESRTMGDTLPARAA